MFTLILFITFLALTVVLLFFGLVTWDFRLLKLAGLLAVSLVTFGAVSQMLYEHNNPCIKYETRYNWNFTLKTMMPYKHCIERGNND